MGIFFKDSQEKGQALVEFALVLPVQLLFILAIMQFSLMYIAKQMAEYAAFCAARAALVHEESGYKDSMAQSAARYAIAPIHPRGNMDFVSPDSSLYEVLPGNNKLVVDLSRTTKKEVIAIVKYDYMLVIPVVNWFIAAPQESSYLHGTSGTSGGSTNSATQRHGYPHITVQGLCMLPKPWRK